MIVVSIQEIYEKAYSVEASLIIDNGQKASQYNVFSIPTTFFIDEQHRIRDRLNGFVTAQELEQKLISLKKHSP